MAHWASAAEEPLPVSYFEGIAYSGNDPRWLNSALKHRPDADTAAWLAWLAPPDLVADAGEIGIWLGYGVSRQEFEIALTRTLPGSRVLEVAAATGWSRRAAARCVIQWAKADCLPTAAHFAQLSRKGLDYAHPGVAAIEVASEQTMRLGIQIDWTELGVMLALSGNRASLLAAIKRGARNTNDLIDFERAVDAPNAGSSKRGTD